MDSVDQEKVSKKARAWIRENKRRILGDLCNPEIYTQEDHPVTVFMAGSPGAGKTEFSKSLIESFAVPIVRIDADDIREMMRDIGYNGYNSDTYNIAAVDGVQKLYDHTLKNKYSAVLDGTFAYGRWQENIERSLRRGRQVSIYYVYQDPLVAWSFVLKRQQEQGRRVPPEVFINSFLNSIINVDKAIELFGSKINVFYAQHNSEKNVEKLEVQVSSIEQFIPRRYTKQQLESIVYERKDN